jgi:hypothetical protein
MKIIRRSSATHLQGLAPWEALNLSSEQVNGAW